MLKRTHLSVWQANESSNFDRFFPVDAVLGSVFLINSRYWKTFEVAFFHLPHAEPGFQWPHDKKWAQLVKVGACNQKSEPILASIINALQTWGQYYQTLIKDVYRCEISLISVLVVLSLGSSTSDFGRRMPNSEILIFWHRLSQYQFFQDPWRGPKSTIFKKVLLCSLPLSLYMSYFNTQNHLGMSNIGIIGHTPIE